AERTPAQARRDFRLLTAVTSRTPSGVRVRYGSIPGPAGRLPVRWYTPRTGRAPRPLLVWFHGGGFVVGDLFTADGTARTLADRSGAVVLSVGYRLAPEHDCLAAVDDAWAALNWAATHAGELGADPAGVAPALIRTAEWDLLRDDGEAYAERLGAAGVAVERVRYPGQIHGFLAMDRIFPAARRALDRVARAVAAVSPVATPAVPDTTP